MITCKLNLIHVIILTFCFGTYGLYYGFILLVVVLFTFFGIALREKIYFYFVSYVFVMGMFQLSLDGFSFEFLWPHSNYLGNHSILIFAAISMLSLLAYTNQIFRILQREKMVHQPLLLLLWTCLLLSIY